MSIVRIAGLVLALMAAAGDGGAQSEYPTRSIEFVIAYAPGGPVDSAVRVIHPTLAATLGVPIVLVTRAGAGGALAMDFVAKAKPDGYTVVVTANPTLSILPSMMREGITYKLADFEPVGTFAVDSQGILVKTDGPFKTFEEFVAYAKKNPGKLNYGSPGMGTVSFFNMEILKSAYGLDIAHVPFAGSGPVKNAILGGHVQLAASALSPVLPVIRSGDVIPLVTTSSRRLPGVNAPSMAEKGFTEATLSTNMQLYVPARTPREVVARLSKALETTMRNASVIAAMEKTGMLPEYQDGETTRKAIEAESLAVAQVVKKLNLAK